MPQNKHNWFHRKNYYSFYLNFVENLGNNSWILQSANSEETYKTHTPSEKTSHPQGLVKYVYRPSIVLHHIAVSLFDVKVPVFPSLPLVKEKTILNKQPTWKIMEEGGGIIAIEIPV